MKIIYSFVVAALMVCGIEVPSFRGPAEPVQGTWAGEISASHCVLMHSQDMTSHDCTLKCVGEGAQFVLVSNGEIYTFADQTDKALRARAGDTVSVTGELKGNVLTARSIEKVQR